MKANHNSTVLVMVLDLVVTNISCLKNESKSQLYAGSNQRFKVVTNISCLKNESKSQLNSERSCYNTVVTNISCLKNESKSQLNNRITSVGSSCYKYQLFKE